MHLFTCFIVTEMNYSQNVLKLSKNFHFRSIYQFMTSTRRGWGDPNKVDAVKFGLYREIKKISLQI